MTIHISHQHRAVVLPYRTDVAQFFPHCKQVQFDGQTMLVVPHGNDEARLLRNLGIPVPPPIMEHYEWPGDKKPFEQQVKTAALLTMNPAAYVLNDMGTGKTKACLWSFDWLASQGAAKRMLVIAPLSTLRFVWMREVMHTTPHRKVIVLDGPRERRLKRLAEPADIYVTNHDGVRTIFAELQKRRDIDVICIDEVGAYRNARAERSKIAQNVVKQRAFVWGMTGSPTPTAPTDAFGLAKLITPHTAPKSFSHFRNLTMAAVNQFKWVPRADAAEVVAATLQPSVRFTLEDTTELPALIERPFQISQGSRQEAIYKEVANKAAALLKEGSLTAANGGVVLSKLLQISQGYVYLDNGSCAALDNDARLEAMVEIIDGSRGKVIVFAPFVHSVDGICGHLDKERLHFDRITGATSSGERDRIFREFQQTDKIDVLVAHPQCMAHGITLTAADTIVWFSAVTSLETFEQANARIRRVGQTRKQQVFMMFGTSAEKRVYNRLQQKRDVQDSALDILQGLTE